jgi:hypothetical protein
VYVALSALAPPATISDRTGLTSVSGAGLPPQPATAAASAINKREGLLLNDIPGLLKTATHCGG